MSTRSSWVGTGLLCVFVVSGFAGLIYQSIWSHYLGLVLGHAAYAQCLVLAIFMGGMSLGAWIASRRSPRWGSVIRIYAVVELIVGLIGIAFHPIFVRYVAFSQDTVLPGIGADWLAHLYQWTSAAALIAPQCVLLGMTFPLVSAGYLRLQPDQDGRIVGGLYFTNSIGAALGALVCTFMLLPAIGMPGAVLTAGLLNVLVALIAWPLGRMADDEIATAIDSASTTASKAPMAEPASGLRGALLAAAFITGATSFVYEIGWVRLLNQVLGTTVHSFELMLAAFIAGLAFGGYWIRRRSGSIADPVAYAGYAQIWMGVAALLSLPLFAQSFQWVEWIMAALARTAQGYTVFSAGGAAISLIVMFPAAFFAGMTLPLFTVALLRGGFGESSIGRVYAFNTLGAIVGVFATIHLLIPALGVRLGIVVAALADIALGLYLLRRLALTSTWRGYIAAASMAVLAVVASLSFGRVDPEKQAAGVFRTGAAQMKGLQKVAYVRDGKTSTVTVASFADGSGMISTNGKPDAALALRSSVAPTLDEITMIMAAALPLYLHPRARDIAVIGWGSGMTLHTLLGSALPRSVEAVEIERAMYDGARLFGERVARAYADPRLHIVFDDARTYFSTKARKYDVIISEPSNPWVSGVASLFTTEFYEFVRGHLNSGGILVQWLQSYEIDDALLATMIAALLERFPHVDVYVTNTSDLLFVAGETPRSAASWQPLASSPLAQELERVGLKGPADIALRHIGNQDVLATFVRLNAAAVHSDFFPVVSLNAPRSRFSGNGSTLLQLLVENGLPVLDLVTNRRPPARSELPQFVPTSGFATAYRLAAETADALRGGEVVQSLSDHSSEVAAHVALLRQPFDSMSVATWSTALANVAATTLGMLPAADLDGVWIAPKWNSGPGESEFARLVLHAFDAAARRDAAATRRFCQAALEKSPEQAAKTLREELLVLAMAGAIGEGKPADAPELEKRFGADIPPSLRFGRLRSFLLAWSDR